MAMELHPFLESDIRPAPKWWYVMSGAGESPTMRVGHSATFVPGLHDGEHGKVLIVGGANPSQVGLNSIFSIFSLISYSLFFRYLLPMPICLCLNLCFLNNVLVYSNKDNDIAIQIIFVNILTYP